MSAPRRIWALTGARSEYDLLYPVLRALRQHDGVEPGVVAAAAHLSPFHGLGIRQIEEDGFRIAGRIESLLCSESWQGRALSFAALIEALTRLLAPAPPDVLLIAGDREEALAGALTANFLGVPVAHLSGGDRCIASELDEVLRPAISKLSHLHFTACEDHRQRLLRMGELPDRVWDVGASGLDRLRDEPDVPDAVLADRFGIDPSRPFFLLIHHPSPLFDPENSGREMAEVLRGVLAMGCPVFCSYPNFDPGNVAMRGAIDQARARHANLIVYHNLPRSLFVALYRRCAAVVGNSSSIVLESGFLKVPGILAGRRQDLRQTGANVVRVAATADAVGAACRRAVEDAGFRATVRQAPCLYGDGRTGPRVADILARIDLPRELLLKTIPY
jgi:GDP/UDP-N,N'-diacetylbacillosamine 2-epimerase (hydrolysing)